MMTRVKKPSVKGVKRAATAKLRLPKVAAPSAPSAPKVGTKAASPASILKKLL